VKVLDVATGGGHVARRLGERGCEVVSLDPSPGMQADVLARAGCEGEEAERVRELLADRMTSDGTAWTDTKILLRARKSPS